VAAQEFLRHKAAEKSTILKEIFLVEELLDVASGQGAAVSDLAQLDVLDQLSELGSGGEFELGRFNGGLLVEQAEDDIIVRFGHGAGGQVADQAAVALSGLGVGNHEESGVIILKGGTTRTARSSDGQSADGQTLDEEKTTSDSEGGCATGTQSPQSQVGSGSGSGCCGSGGEEEGGSGRLHDAGHKGEKNANLGVHD